ncbi:hypothetical protein AB0I66_25105 [Streptomyces sp. NPDC050439]|uniref:hypothetical protein n=1 Tax=unclassified Streptomyces TaxID=2593676 RepID=UPI0034136203
MPIDPYAALHALLRAEAVRNAPAPAQPEEADQQQEREKEQERGVQTTRDL